MNLWIKLDCMCIRHTILLQQLLMLNISTVIGIVNSECLLSKKNIKNNPETSKTK